MINSIKIGTIHRLLIFHEAKNEMITNTYFLFSRELENNLEKCIPKRSIHHRIDVISFQSSKGKMDEFFEELF